MKDILKVLAILTISVIGTDAAEFRTKVDGTSYLITYRKQNWYRALLICKQKGMELITLDSEKKLNSVIQVIEQSGRNETTDEYWISGTDLGNENSFSWISTGEFFEYEPWHDGQPDNANNNENCVEIINWFNKYRFNDQSCDDKRYYICTSVEVDVHCNIDG